MGKASSRYSSIRSSADGHGIRQFLDIGPALPTADNAHDIAQRAAPEARIVYADYDRWLFGHACVRSRGDRELAAEAKLAAEGDRLAAGERVDLEWIAERGLQILHVRHLVDPAGHHPGPGPGG